MLQAMGAVLVFEPLCLRLNATLCGAGTGTLSTPHLLSFRVTTPAGHAAGGDGKWGLIPPTSLPPPSCSCGNGPSRPSPRQPRQPRQRPPGQRS